MVATYTSFFAMLFIPLFFGGSELALVGVVNYVLKFNKVVTVGFNKAIDASA